MPRVKRQYEEMARDLSIKDCESHMEGRIRFHVMEVRSRDGERKWMIVDVTCNITVYESSVISTHDTLDAANFVADILNGWQTERCKLTLASEEGS